MPRTTQHPKAETFNFRVDPSLKTAFTQATEAEDKPAAQVLREFMRAYVERRDRRLFEAEASDSRVPLPNAPAIARATKRDCRELGALFDEDHFADEWKA